MRALYGVLSALIVLFALPHIGPAADLSEADNAELVRLTREWGYLRPRALQASALAPQATAMSAILGEISGSLERAVSDPATTVRDREQAQRRLRSLSAQINAALAPEAAFTAAFTPAYTRQDPDALVTPSLKRTAEVLALPGEHPAAAVLVANCQDQPLRLRLTTRLASPSAINCQFRRHVFMENWYYREKARATDPLTLLPREGGAWVLALEPGEIVKLHLGLEVARKARGTHRCGIVLSGPDGRSLPLDLRVRVLAAAPPATSPFEHLAFMYPRSNIASHSPVPVARDLAAHGVTMMEYPAMPPATFAADGTLLTADFARHDALLRDFGPYIRRFLIFWWAELKSEDGQTWPMLSPGWRVAFTNLLRVWFAHAAKLGYGQDRFVLLPCDEPSSHQLADAPNQQVRDLAATMAYLKQAFPKLPLVATLSYYAYVPDLRVYLPYLNMAIANWPWVEQLAPKFAPPEHNPRKMFFEEMLPLLEQRRSEHGMALTSYHVASGKNDDLLSCNRAYPALMVGLGMTGIAHWAYNDITGSSWHDWDGTPWLDYQFVYDGSEEHPLNRQYNPTGEIVVTSIRWESVLAGMEDARLLLHLRTLREAGKLSPRRREQVSEALAAAAAMAHGTDPLTDSKYEMFARKLRLLYAEGTR